MKLSRPQLRMIEMLKARGRFVHSAFLSPAQRRTADSLVRKGVFISDRLGYGIARLSEDEPMTPAMVKTCKRSIVSLLRQAITDIERGDRIDALDSIDMAARKIRSTLPTGYSA